MYVVYAIKPDRKNAKVMKIGITKDIDRRLRELTTGSADQIKIVTLIQCKSKAHALHIEQMILQEFKSLRIHGEWLKPTQNLLNYLHGIKNNDPEICNRALQKHLDQVDRKHFDWKSKNR